MDPWHWQEGNSPEIPQEQGGQGQRLGQKRAKPVGLEAVPTGFEDALQRFGALSLGEESSAVPLSISGVASGGQCGDSTHQVQAHGFFPPRQQQPQQQGISLAACQPVSAADQQYQGQELLQGATLPISAVDNGILQQQSPPAGDGGEGQGLGQRLYTEDEVRAALAREVEILQQQNKNLQLALVNMERDARAAIQRAEQAEVEAKERLAAAEYKNFALSVHLAQSNRPSHLA